MSDFDAQILKQHQGKTVGGRIAEFVFAMTVLWCFFLPFKFGDMVCVPEAASVLPFSAWEWILNNWGDAFFALVSSLLLLASICFPLKDVSLNHKQIIYCSGFASVFLLAFIGVIKSNGIDHSAGEMVHLGGATAFLLLIANTAGNNKRRCQKLLGAMGCGFGFLLIAGLYQYFCGFDSMKNYLAEQEAAGMIFNEELKARLLDDRLTAGCGSSATLAGMLLILTPPALLMLWDYGKRFHPARTSQILLTSITGLVAAAEFILARSRAAFLAFVIAAVITIWCHIKSLRLRLITAAVAILVVAGGAWYIASAGRGFGSMTARADYYVSAAKMLATAPLMGAGWGGFADNYMRLKIFDINENARDPHSMLATLGSQAGILPLLAGVIWLVFIFRELLKKIRSKNAGEQTKATFFLLALAGFWIQCQMDLHFQVTSTLATALAIGFFAFSEDSGKDITLQRNGKYRSVTAIFAIAAISGSCWWLRAEYSYTHFHNTITQATPANAYQIDKAFRNCISARPDSAFVYITAGNHFLAKRNYQAAREAYMHAMEINPYCYTIYGQLAKLEYQQGKISEAVQWAGKCLQLNPYHTTSQEILAGSTLINPTKGVY